MQEIPIKKFIENLDKAAPVCCGTLFRVAEEALRAGNPGLAQRHILAVAADLEDQARNVLSVLHDIGRVVPDPPPGPARCTECGILYALGNGDTLCQQCRRRWNWKPDENRQ